MDTAWIAVAVSLVGCAITFGTFWMGQGSTKTIAEAAKKSVEDAHNRIDENEKAAANFREKVATDYVSKTEMVHLENRIVGEINKLGSRLDQFLVRTQG